MSQRVDQDLIELVNEFKQGNVTLCSIESSVIDESGNTYSIDSSAIEESGNMPMGTIPNHKMHLTTAVTAIRIDQKVNGTWSTYDTLYAIDNPNFYQYNTANYVDTVSFYGTQGTEYRVTITAYAGKSGRYDSATVTSYTAICK